MINDIQHKASNMGSGSCYFFSILKIAEDCGAGHLDAFREYENAIARGWMRADGFMERPADLISDLTGCKWIVLKAGVGHELPLDYTLAPLEKEILRFERTQNGMSEAMVHFVVGNGHNQVEWDPWENSATVANGKLVSRRIFRRV